ncbi:MAG: ATP-binding protein [Bacteroidales bacterium]
MKSKLHYIEQLISQGENQHLDFKFAINNSKKIARTLVAFANTDGGKLLIGVKDNGIIAGVKTDEEYHMIAGAAELYCKPKINFENKEWLIEGKKILEIIVPESIVKPHFSLSDNNKWQAYVRVNDENILANGVLLNVWRKIKQKKGLKIESFEAGQKLLKFLEINPEINFTTFTKLAKISRNRAVQILSDLIAIGLVEYKYENNQFIYKSNSLKE